MSPKDKPSAWLHGAVRSPAFSIQAGLEAGYLLRLLQSGHKINMPHSRSMPSIGRRCHELRIVDKDVSWRIIYRIDDDAIVLVEVCRKKSGTTPKRTIALCKRRLKDYDSE